MSDSLPEGWQAAYDSSRGHYYYFNTALGLSQWHHPSLDEPKSPLTEVQAATGDATAASTSDLAHSKEGAAVEASTSQDSETSGGWYYRDVYGHVQGPFTQEQLTSWRAQLPMDLLVWAAEGSDVGTTGKPDDKPSSSSDEMPAIELAELLGDGELLANWRQMCPLQGEVSAPPATVWEQWLSSQGAEDDGSGRVSYADAVLAGLPSTDEAVIISQLATAAGKSLEEVINFVYAAAAADPNAPAAKEPQPPPPPDAPPAPAPVYDYSNYEFTGVKDKMRGKIKTNLPGPEAGGAASLYQELKGWCDPAKLEEALMAMSARKGTKVPPAVWKKLKERKAQMKKKLRAQWMQA